MRTEQPTTCKLSCNSYYVFIGVGVSCRISYSIVSYVSLCIDYLGCGRESYFSAFVYL